MGVEQLKGIFIYYEDQEKKQCQVEEIFSCLSLSFLKCLNNEIKMEKYSHHIDRVT